MSGLHGSLVFSYLEGAGHGHETSQLGCLRALKNNSNKHKQLLNNIEG